MSKITVLETESPVVSKHSPHAAWWRFPWSRKKKLWAGLGAMLLVMLVGAGTTYALMRHNKPTQVVVTTPAPTATPQPTPVPRDVPNPFNGVLYTADEASQSASLRPLAVMVENHVDARPQSGLQDAEVLYEAMAEGGITRFMAMYLHNAPSKVGPVRSARKHFVEWASEYDATYAHWGGSAEALTLLGTISRPKNLDEFQNPNAFYRDTTLGRATEHTGYTSVGALRKVASANGWEAPGSFRSWLFKEDVAITSRPQAQTVTLGFLGTPGYNAKFDYRPETNDYARSTGGQAHLDSAGQQLTTKSIVLQFQTVQNYVDTNGHAAVHVTTIGTGKAVLIQDGVATEGAWAKPDMNGRTIFSDASGKELAFNRGKIWVVSVPVGSSVSY